MPQMSPLMWTVLMIFFIFFYFVLGVTVYYDYYFIQLNISVDGISRFNKFLVFF